MFGLGGPELIVILLIALVIFGPRKLPEVGQQIGRALREFKKSTASIKSEISEAVDAEGLKDVQSTIKSTTDELGMKDLKKELASATDLSDITESVQIPDLKAELESITDAPVQSVATADPEATQGDQPQSKAG